MSGEIGNLSPKQAEKLEEFKAQVKDILNKPSRDDYYCLRWLRARNFDVGKAVTMIRNSMETRKKMGLDTLITDFKAPEVMEKHYQGGLVGETKNGNPIWIDPIGGIDPKGLLRSARNKDIILTRLQNTERMYEELLPALSKKYGKRIEGLCYIMDLEGLGTKHLWKPGIDLFNQFSTILQDNYPESLKVIYIVRAPKIFPVIYALIKPILDERVRKKIQVLGQNFQSALLKDIPAESLPVHWGGTMTDPKTGDPKCPSLVNPGGTIPQKFYIQEIQVPEDKNLESQTIKKKFDLTFEVTKKDSAIRYVFKTEGGDIGLAVFLQIGSKEMKPLKELEKHNSHLVYEDGSFDCPEPGTYILRFDNSHSWTKNKTLHYFAEVIEPDALLDEMSTDLSIVDWFYYEFYNSSMENRKKLGLDSIVTDYKAPEVIEKYYQGGMVGEDKQGNPVWIDPMGNIDPKGLLRSAKKKDIVLSRIQHIEQLYQDVFPGLSKKYGKHIQGMTYIMDLEGLGTKHLWKPGLDTFIEFLKVLQDNYPETLKIIYIVRAPRIFPVIYALIKPFLDEHVRKKIQVLSQNFQSTLLKDIPAESLPVHWGGTMTDPKTGDPKCPHLITLGGPVPEKYYNQEPVVPEDKNLNVEVVKKKFDLTFEVTKKDSAIRYVFKTEGGDIGLTVFLQTGDKEMKQVQEMEKHSSHLVYEDGSFDCPEAGTYVLRFDNSHSWTKNKTLHYFAEVIEPDALLDEMSTDL
ncbi:SEC14-like protein 2 [Saccoglossus kowalevskii]|uniref:SEC14-like protein 2-like n=1 Tax=Saccoglossus kowalevskii TaxID=10224 RepID=A0ABM0GI86_SACKO|nr:PREDICTED: SEC14-like protein 2-like [Saccoglossus kowalevskii]